MVNCDNCSKDIERKWSFCPYCGAHVPKSKLKNMFSVGVEDLFDKMFRDIHEQMFDSFSRQQKDYKAKFDAPNVKGIWINISSDQTGVPRINVSEMGAPEKKYQHVHHHHAARPAPKETIEPKAEIKKLPGKQFIDIELPGVNLQDVDVVEGEESVEIRAYKGDKMYFKILQIEPQQTIQSKDFKNGKLHLEIGRG